MVEFEKLVLVFHRVMDESEESQYEVARLRKEVEAVRSELAEVKGSSSQAEELASVRLEVDRLEAALQERNLEKESMALEMSTQSVAHASILAAKNAEILKGRKAAALAEKRAESLGAKVSELEATIEALAAQLDSHLSHKYVGSSDRAVAAYHKFLPDFSGEVFTGLEDPWLGIVGDLVHRVQELSPDFPAKEVPLFAAYLKMMDETPIPSAADQLAEQIRKSLTDEVEAGPSKSVGRATAEKELVDEGETSEAEP